MKLHCKITLPASKSESNRALMIAAYGGFAPDFQNLSDSHDTLVLVEALRRIRQNIPVIDIADCGTAARFLLTYLACHEGDWLLTGTERMKRRPMAPLVDALRSLDADIQYIEEQGFLPLQIHGKPIQGGKVSIDMTQSSQFASSLLLAAPMFSQGLELELLGNPCSLPYLDMTIEMMCYFLAQVERRDKRIVVRPQPYKKQPFTIESDWSAASYWYEMAAFSEECEIRLRFLNPESVVPVAHRRVEGSKDRPNLQGDAIIALWMESFGVCTTTVEDGIILTKMPFERKPLAFDFADCPDLYPTMAATCAGLGVDATFTGLANLSLKESDRVETMRLELAKLVKNPIRFSAHNDHRIVMALAPLSMRFGTVSFDHPEVVEKSYPKFWEDAAFLPIER
jgi:3-phosphoshikimate 1-carboxyvinyltransferase